MKRAFKRVVICVATLALGCALGCAAADTAAPDAETVDADEPIQAAEADSSAASDAESVAEGEGGANPSELKPGEYEVEVDTDSSMFHVNEACDGMGVLTVSEDGSMVVHFSLVSKKIVNLYVGTAAEAEVDAGNLLEPTVDVVTYDDGMEEEVFGFDVPVPALDEPFDVAILGAKGVWYDHTVTVSSPESE
ncbi:Uncharacterised protein [Slackia heliotrinireducens]|uniref:Uncharacterized protein n=1 Tax=Slackia heliotrinireducens (strain ATCC 29202 / DSM 20476 / NCTC 11029 / RHS 1) TaxID=471855 RepID=C7N216_SLAHD|nr:hypothetical protein [Slackia heliotrinireducens]ACV23457.1 hypothetical protein Shel_24490 [Slackia heliotrinireducens DSM 20476]VEH02780.1 Uncharacterised protein [Slackia heliotrinireducens]